MTTKNRRDRRAGFTLVELLVVMVILGMLASLVLPNFFFHVTTAYASLRHNGVELGKQDFMRAPG